MDDNAIIFRISVKGYHAEGGEKCWGNTEENKEEK